MQSILERIIEDRAYVPVSVKEKEKEDNCQHNDSSNDDEEVNVDDDTVKPDKRSDECLLVLKYAALAIQSHLNERKGEVGLSVRIEAIEVAFALHEILIDLNHCGSPAGPTKTAIISLCDKSWLSKEGHPESFIAQFLPFLVLAACEDTDTNKATTNPHIKRLYKFPHAFDSINFADPSSDSLHQSLLKVREIIPEDEGKEFIDAILQQGVDFDDGNTNESYHSDSDSFGAGFYLADGDDNNYDNNDDDDNEDINVPIAAPNANAELNAANVVPNPPPIAAPNANAESNAANAVPNPHPIAAPNANAESNAANVVPNPHPIAAPNANAESNAANVVPNPPPITAPNANAESYAANAVPNPPPIAAPIANAELYAANAVPNPPPIAAPNANANAKSNANAAPNPPPKGVPNGVLKGASRAAHIAVQNTASAGAKGVAGEVQTRNCVPKSLAHILRDVAKQEGTGNYLLFRLTAERQTRSNTISSKKECGILISDIERTLCKRLASLEKKGDQKDFSKPEDWMPLLKEWGFEAKHVNSYQTSRGCKAALLGFQDPLLVLLALAKNCNDGKDPVYNMSHAVGVLPNSDSRCGKCTKIIDPDRPEDPIEVSKQEVQNRYLNWVEKPKIEKNTLKT
jgi:hypothetical protein